MSHSLRVLFLLSGFALAVFCFGLTYPTDSLKASTLAGDDLPLRGWMWSSNAGWISFCGGQNSPDCLGSAEYQVIVNNTTGEFRGNAWAADTTSSVQSGLGALSFDKTVTGIPPAPPFNNNTDSFIARALPGSGQVEGWGRFIAGCDWVATASRCLSSGPGPNTGSWDGWVRFSPGTALDGSAYQGLITTNGGGRGSLIGYAWGGEVVGWIAASTTASFYPPPHTEYLPTIDVIMTANPVTGYAPITTKLTAVVTTSSSLPITYHFACDSTGGSSENITLTTTTKTVIFPCHYNAGTFIPYVEVFQDGVFAKVTKTSIATNAKDGKLSYRRGVRIEIPVDE